MALPGDKLAKAQDVIRQVQGATKVTRRVLDSLFGYLSFCSTVVYGGRAFLHGVRRLRYRADGVARAGHHKIHVNRALKEDMRWWQAHLVRLNGDRRVPMVAAGVNTSRWKPTWMRGAVREALGCSWTEPSSG